MAPSNINRIKGLERSQEITLDFSGRSVNACPNSAFLQRNSSVALKHPTVCCMLHVRLADTFQHLLCARSWKLDAGIHQSKRTCLRQGGSIVGGCCFLFSPSKRQGIPDVHYEELLQEQKVGGEKRENP